MSDYIRGEMDISDHKATFDGVMNVSVYVGLMTSIVVLYLTLVFCGVTDWFSGLIATAIVGAISGFALKQGVLYWTSFIAFAVITLISGFLISLFVG